MSASGNKGGSLGTATLLVTRRGGSEEGTPASSQPMISQQLAGSMTMLHQASSNHDDVVGLDSAWSLERGTFRIEHAEIELSSPDEARPAKKKSEAAVVAVDQ